jgi:hypothetical protein
MRTCKASLVEGCDPNLYLGFAFRDVRILSPDVGIDDNCDPQSEPYEAGIIENYGNNNFRITKNDAEKSDDALLLVAHLSGNLGGIENKVTGFSRVLANRNWQDAGSLYRTTLARLAPGERLSVSGRRFAAGSNVLVPANWVIEWDGDHLHSYRGTIETQDNFPACSLAELEAMDLSRFRVGRTVQFVNATMGAAQQSMLRGDLNSAFRYLKLAFKAANGSDQTPIVLRKRREVYEQLTRLHDLQRPSG